MASESSFFARVTDGSFVAGLAAGFVLAIGVLLLVAVLLGRDFVEGVRSGSGPRPRSSLVAATLPDTTASIYGTVPGEWRLRSVSSDDTTTFSALRGTPVVLNMWATWCTPCRTELPTLQALQDSTGAVLLVSTESQSTVRSFLEEGGYTMPAYVIDYVPTVLREKGVPRTYILDRGGRVVYRHVGAADWDQFSTYDFLNRLRGASTPSGAPRPPR